MLARLPDIFLLLVGFVAAQQSTTNIDSCSCGFYDPVSGAAWTDSIIVYFNETSDLPTNFAPQTFEHQKESGWTTTYRQGASPDNVQVGNVSQPTWRQHSRNPNSLELFVSPSTKDHLSVGGSLASLRQDIMYGSFRASMRGPHPKAGGSALSMMMPFNTSVSIEMDMMNTDDTETARVMTLVGNEYSDINLGVNYTTIQNGTSGVPSTSPWNYMTLQIDWTNDYLNFSVNDNTTRSIEAEQATDAIPRLGMPLVFKHWSDGDKNFMQGPPTQRTSADVAWVRAFFNSSTWSTQQHADFDGRCQPSLACPLDDSTLRGSSPINATNTLAWTPPPRDRTLVYRSAIVAGVFGFFGFFVLFHAILSRWIPWHWLAFRRKSKHGEPKMSEKAQGQAGKSTSTLVDSSASSQHSVDFDIKKSHMSTATTAVNSRAGSASNSRAPSPVRKPGEDIVPSLLSSSPVIPSSPISRTTRSSTLVSVKENEKATFSENSLDSPSKQTADPRRESSDEIRPLRAPRVSIAEVASRNPSEVTLATLANSRNPSETSLVDKGKSAAKEDEHHHILPHLHLPHIPHHHDDGTVGTTSNFHTSDLKADAKGATRDPVKLGPMIPSQGEAPRDVKTPANVKIDYLAGAVAFSCICVTFVHFGLTFLPGISGWGPLDHSASDHWAKKTIGPYLLTEVWIGPFFTTSARFLSARYFRSGKLSDIGNKTLLRAPRLVVPVMMIALMQYFAIELGATTALQYLPSVSWTVWPYVAPYANFGGYMNAILDLSYLIPNGAPAIVPHYCVGVLWTIPVQLQNSYTILLGVVMVREIKTHWKRFAFYVFCIVNYWYAFSWGASFWLGLMLSDLAVTYKYKEYIQARPWIHYPMLTLMWCLVGLSTSVFMVSNNFGYDFLTPERGIHADWNTGLPISQTANAGYPNYYEPRLNTLVLSGALQVIVELSTCVQWFLNLPPWQRVFPHIMTIYMIHGFIFWTAGAACCVALAVAGIPYWANMLVTVAVCYGGLAIVCEIVTPLTDKTAKNACKNLWRWAQEEPVPKRPTLGGYGKELILNRQGAMETEAKVNGTANSSA